VTAADLYEDADGWSLTFVDQDGAILTTSFYGPSAETRAREYARLIEVPILEPKTHPRPTLSCILGGADAHS
jgi:hypothetical protein